MNKTPIEWCRTYKPDGTFEEGHTVNPIRFRPYGSERTTTMCMKVSPGCKNCYAESITRRFWPKDATVRFAGYTAKGLTNGEFILDEKQLLSVLKRRKPTKIFWGDMTDLFQDGIPDAFLDKCFAVCALTPHITHMFLTKRPQRMLDYMKGHFRVYSPGPREMAFSYLKHIPGYDSEHSKWIQFAANAFNVLPLPNVWLGVSVEAQAAADTRIPLLLHTPAAVRFISAEPLLGPVDLNNLDAHALSRAGGHTPSAEEIEEPWKYDCLTPGDIYWGGSGGVSDGPEHEALDWVICGGESGAGARPMHPDWARSLRDECKAASVPFFFKQWGEWAVDHEAPNCEDWSPGHALVNRLNGDIRGSESLSDETTVSMWKAGKKCSGAILDGREWRQFPAARP